MLLYLRWELVVSRPPADRENEGWEIKKKDLRKYNDGFKGNIMKENMGE